VLLACGGGDDIRERDARPSRAAPAAGVAADDIDRLRALGYVEVAEDDIADRRTGVVVADRERSSPGVNLYVTSGLCRADIIDAAGAVLHTWQHLPCRRWSSSALLPDGGLAAAGQHPAADLPPGHRRRYLLRLARDGTFVWEAGHPVHHHVSLTPEGHIVTLTRRFRRFPEIDPRVPVKDNGIAVFTAGGALVAERSLYEVLAGADDVFRFQRVAPTAVDGDDRTIDLFHANAVHWLPPGAVTLRDGRFERPTVLVCIRHQDSVALIDWDAGRVVWAWGQGVLAGPHDAHVLPNGHILVFDNGLGRNWSRVVEVDPVSERIVWEYRGGADGEIYSRIRGSSQRLANGNTLIVDSTHGRAVEVTPAGTVVWDFRTPHRDGDGKPYNIVFMRRYTAAELPPALRPDGASPAR